MFTWMFLSREVPNNATQEYNFKNQGLKLFHTFISFKSHGNGHLYMKITLMIINRVWAATQFYSTSGGRSLCWPATPTPNSLDSQKLSFQLEENGLFGQKFEITIVLHFEL